MYKAATKNKLKEVLILVSVWGFILGCSTDRKISRKMGLFLKQSEVLKKHHVGFAVYDLNGRKTIYEKNADQYFIPASNTKLLTFYTSLKMLQDSVAGIRYIVRHDSLIFWGTGDPSFLQSRLKSEKVVQFLKGSDKKLFFSTGRYTGARYGKGWAWDDYNDYYQSELTELPIMDNLITLGNEQGVLTVKPEIFKDAVMPDTLRKDSIFKVLRMQNENRFGYPVKAVPRNYAQQVPYKTSIYLTKALLENLLGKPVGLLSMKIPDSSKVIYSEKRDSILKEMLIPSDNFIAEQLLLLCADQTGLQMNTDTVIAHAKRTFLRNLPDAPVWVDGSGLSRYNLVTPRDLVVLLTEIYRAAGDSGKLYGMLPAGGKSGTLKNAYAKTDHPFVFGKTGTLSNNYCQSGYVLTRKNRTYVFSFMNNNFVAATADVRKEIEKVITYLHEHY
ncbi:D-alanyl-D-alanine carboxypeptidase/D-alanyl-D-alanine-endopeptidase [Pedobacter frigoris]|uniref:D-alanyl-D-alanine carboxypeptidase/D-alanyl-D-alanine-endopeptidase n=1 Tax=Pedobacter frigoris TaxID=2571272 RepID=UPI0029315D97|nr:D-alanyl-D-alanine carboxypeptidase [Pedobacter frigoris]